MPEKIMSGKFAVYITDSGGVHVALAGDGDETVRHIEVPKMMVKMLVKKGGALNEIMAGRNRPKDVVHDDSSDATAVGGSPDYRLGDQE